MYSVGLAEVLAIISILISSIVFFLYWREKKSLDNLFPRQEGGNIRDKLSEVLEEQALNKREILILNKNIREVSRKGLEHIQRFAILRYNPYDDTGGDQSFSVVMLDGKNNGVLLTSLHTRSGTRVYAKPIMNGKSDMNLAKEEKEVLNNAMGE